MDTSLDMDKYEDKDKDKDIDTLINKELDSISI